MTSVSDNTFVSYHSNMIIRQIRFSPFLNDPHIFKSIVLFCYKKFFSSKNLDPSYKTQLDFLGLCLRGKYPVL